MKRILGFCLLLLVVFLGFGAAAEETNYPTINSAIKKIYYKHPTEIEVDYCELADFSMDCQGDDIMEGVMDFKIAVFKRLAPEKDVVSSDSNGAAENEDGKDQGGKLFYCAEMMRKVPYKYRARSMEDATIIVIAENKYFPDGTISDRLNSEEKKYTKYSSSCYINVYNVQTKECETHAIRYIDAPVFFADTLLAERIINLKRIDALSSLFGNPEQNMAPIMSQALMFHYLGLFSFTEYQLLTNCIEQEDREGAVALLECVFWDIAGEILNAEALPDYQKQMREAIAKEDRQTFLQCAEEKGSFGLERESGWISRRKTHTFDTSSEASMLGITMQHVENLIGLMKSENKDSAWKEKVSNTVRKIEETTCLGKTTIDRIKNTIAKSDYSSVILINENEFWRMAGRIFELIGYDYEDTVYRTIMDSESHTIWNLFSSEVKLTDIYDKSLPEFPVYYVNNYDAAVMWYKMEMLDKLAEAVKEGNAYQTDRITRKLQAAGLIQENTVSLWIECVDLGQHELVTEMADREFWKCAAGILEADPDHAEELKAAVESKSYTDLRKLVALYAYAEPVQDIDLIREKKYYLAPVDHEWFDAELNRMAELLKDNP